MKTVILCLLINSVIYAQTTKELMLNNDWYLVEMNVNGETILPPTNEEIGIITMGVEPIPDNDLLYWFHSEICSSSMDGYISWPSDYQINFFDFAGGFQCTNPDNEQFEYLYASFFGGGPPDEILDCSIIENSDNSLMLTILNESGNTVTYINELMQVEETDKLDINIYPNPVKDKLTIENSDFKITSIKVMDTNGKVVIRHTVSGKRHEIDLAHLPDGVYFVSFEQNGKILKTEKVLKK